ncbi:MAG: NAD-dependent epimerase/dehydratase family protein [Candidatus Woesearchaeota archaeon]|nr:NAD-dependent epimerase/dehydratase family protein [Candidatus Woesearchaeota archaeon]
MILVTGGAGFIGSNLIARLIKEKEDAICLDDFNDYYSVENKRRNVKGLKCKIIEADIRDKERLLKVFQENKITKIVHLAARAGVRPSLENPGLYFDVNINGTINLLEMARQFNIDSFIFASSSSVYGNGKIPSSETDLTESQISPYAVTKKVGELICQQYSHQYNLNITCLRFFTVYGENGRPDMAPFKFYDAIANDRPITMFGDGNTKRDYTYIGDIVDGIVRAIDKNYRFEIFNLGNGNPVILKDFIQVIEKAAGKKAIILRKEMQKGDVDATFADVSKARKMLGYQPKTDVTEGMKRFSIWYKKNYR